MLIGFRLPSREAVDATYDELITHEHQGLQPPYDVFWGARFAIVEDPDGNPVGLMSPSDDEHAASPRSSDGCPEAQRSGSERPGLYRHRHRGRRSDAR